MSLFVDTGVLYAQHDTDASRHETAQRAMKRVTGGAYGRLLISDYVYDETVTLTLSRTGRHADAKLVSDHLLGRGSPDLFGMVFVEPYFERAVEVFERYDDQPLSFTDATTVALVENHDVDHVLAFDEDFDGLVDRVAPDEVGRS